MEVLTVNICPLLVLVCDKCTVYMLACFLAPLTVKSCANQSLKTFQYVHTNIIYIFHTWYCHTYRQIMILLAGIPVAKYGRNVAPTAAVPNLESISLSQAQIANPEMLFKVNNTAKYVLYCTHTPSSPKSFFFILYCVYYLIFLFVDMYVLN